MNARPSRAPSVRTVLVIAIVGGLLLTNGVTAWLLLGALARPSGAAAPPSSGFVHEDVFGGPAQLVQIPWGGSAYWSFSLAAAATLSGGGTQTGGAGSGLEFEVFNDSEFIRFLINEQSAPSYFAPGAGNAPLATGESFHLSFSLPSGGWTFVMMSFAIPDYCRDGCTTSPPPTTVQSDVGLQTSGSVVYR